MNKITRERTTNVCDGHQRWYYGVGNIWDHQTYRLNPNFLSTLTLDICIDTSYPIFNGNISHRLWHWHAYIRYTCVASRCGFNWLGWWVAGSRRSNLSTRKTRPFLRGLPITVSGGSMEWSILFWLRAWRCLRGSIWRHGCTRRLSGWLVVVPRFGFMLFQLSTISSPKACDTILASPWTAELLVLHWNALRNRPFDISTFVVSIRHIHRTLKISSIRAMFWWWAQRKRLVLLSSLSHHKPQQSLATFS